MFGSPNEQHTLEKGNLNKRIDIITLLQPNLVTQVQESHIWFNKAVARWLDIALYKAMQRIIKVCPYLHAPHPHLPGCGVGRPLSCGRPCETLQLCRGHQDCSHAGDLSNPFLPSTFFDQIKTFWAQLSWPDVESSYAYISKILDVSTANTLQ